MMISPESIVHRTAEDGNPKKQKRSSMNQPPTKKVKKEAPQPEKRTTSENQSNGSAVMKKSKEQQNRGLLTVKVKSSKFNGIKKRAMNIENKTAKKPKALQDRGFQVTELKTNKINGTEKKVKDIKKKMTKQKRAQSEIADEQKIQAGVNESTVTKVKSNKINETVKKAKNIRKRKYNKQKRAQRKITAEQEIQAGGNKSTATPKAPFYRENLLIDTEQEDILNFSGASPSRNHGKVKTAPFYMDGKDSEESSDISEEKPKDTVDSKKDEGISFIEEYENKKRELVGEPLSVTSSTSMSAVYAAVSLGTTLYFQGMLQVKVLTGSVEILGYTLNEGETETVCSLPSMSLLGVKVVEGRKVEAEEPLLLSEGVPADWLNDLATQQEGLIGVLEFKQHHPKETRFMKEMGWGQLYACPERQEHWSGLESMLVTPENCHLYRIFQEGPEWRELADTFKVTCNSPTKPVVVVCGAKNVGKSMFLKFITNYILSGQREAGITYIDCDPGQSELSAPCTICSVHVTKPLLQPAHVNDPESLGPNKKEILIGATSPQFCLRQYGTAMETVYADSCTWPSKCTVVNTMGWVEGAGFSCLVDILRTVQPTHVVYIRPHKRYIPISLEGKDVAQSKEGIITKAGFTGVHYNLKVMKSVSLGRHTDIFNARVQRELHILYELSKFLMRNDNSFIIQIPWKKIAIHICGNPVPKERFLHTINGQLVALCHIMEHSLTTLSEDLPKLASISDTAWTFMGWGIIRGIDPVTQELHVLTALDHKVAEKQVNAVLLPKMHLPIAVYKYFCPTGAGPYMQKDSGTKLTVGRQVKSRPTKFLHKPARWDHL